MTTLGVGIIGCGNISAAYLRLGPLFNGIALRAVADLNSAAAEARAAEFGVRAETVEALLAADDIDIIVNLTVPAAHFSVSKAALEAGKHVYSEKPFVLSVDEGKTLLALAEAKGLRVGSAPDTFLGGAHQAARATLDSGAVGQIVGGTCHVMSHGMEQWHPNPDFFFKPGGGPILDLGPYYVANLVQLLGPVKHISAMSSAGFAERTIGNGPREGERIGVETPTNVHALMEFANGAIITLGASWDVWAHRHANMELYGTEGSLYVPDPNFFGGVVQQVQPGDEPAEIGDDGHPFGVANQDGGQANYRMAGLADMAMAIGEGRDHRCNGTLALHVIDVLTTILRAGETGERLTLSTTCERPAALTPADAAKLQA